ncbi:hypothetical protein OS493_006188 [Desmophyllum pertusum]|uniref:Uncharacterized protein n=1 Tax=Desmophyllum pertusum TaxID=174260 RepID=A0A9X0A7Z5_9CNID|nr:hypothetical protein OS493_006188 [Desmophyllum pertusum]
MGDVQQEGNRSYGNLSPNDKKHYQEVAQRINSQEAERTPDAMIEKTISKIRSNVFLHLLFTCHMMRLLITCYMTRLLITCFMTISVQKTRPITTKFPAG